MGPGQVEFLPQIHIMAVSLPTYGIVNDSCLQLPTSMHTVSIMTVKEKMTLLHPFGNVTGVRHRELSSAFFSFLSHVTQIHLFQA